jgi:hypothetical protein
MNGKAKIPPTPQLYTNKWQVKEKAEAEWYLPAQWCTQQMCQPAKAKFIQRPTSQRRRSQKVVEIEEVEVVMV